MGGGGGVFANDEFMDMCLEFWHDFYWILSSDVLFKANLSIDLDNGLV